MRRELRSQSHDETPLLGMPRPRETNSCSNEMRWPKRGQESGLYPVDSICIRKGLHPIPITKTQKPSQSTSKHPPERTPARTDAKTAKGSKTAQQESSSSTGHRVSRHQSLHPTVNTAKGHAQAEASLYNPTLPPGCVLLCSSGWSGIHQAGLELAATLLPLPARAMV